MAFTGKSGRTYMNPSIGHHLEPDGDESEVAPGGAANEPETGPHMMIHTHAKGHTVHIHHQDGRHEAHEHPRGDAEGMAQHVHEQFGATKESGENAAGGAASADEGTGY